MDAGAHRAELKPREKQLRRQPYRTAAQGVRKTGRKRGEHGGGKRLGATAPGGRKGPMVKYGEAPKGVFEMGAENKTTGA